MSKLGATSLHGRRGRASAKAAATTTAEARSATRTLQKLRGGNKHQQLYKYGAR